MKQHWQFHNGPNDFLKLVYLCANNVNEELRNIVMPVLQQGACYALSENVLLAMLASNKFSKRLMAYQTVGEAREKDLSQDKEAAV